MRRSWRPSVDAVVACPVRPVAGTPGRLTWSLVEGGRMWVEGDTVGQGYPSPPSVGSSTGEGAGRPAMAPGRSAGGATQCAHLTHPRIDPSLEESVVRRLHSEGSGGIAHRQPRIGPRVESVPTVGHRLFEPVTSPLPSSFGDLVRRAQKCGFRSRG